ncbi:hypothetical protein [Streptomyces sp. Isolate_45]|uniref:hypothetical protein n=1 Tax=Streptomyces sp. Isolate_45 TaxID=2950111 RepID=UPI002481B4F4|nr:hypothetical protein [Streptomyces sp. Isolate_45]MDA5282522.1 hypothetical protein [Streptomyces sp. Isolate_45]
MRLPPADRNLSPYTGWTKAHWEATADTPAHHRPPVHEHRGPQRTLYAPAPLWRAGANEVVVLEFHRPASRIELHDHPDPGSTTSEAMPQW